jgi:hypothetical protein
VLGTTDAMTGSIPGNPDAILLSLMGVRETGTTEFTALSDTEATVVHQQGTPSAVDGDAVSNDYQVQIPNVLPDTYSTTLNYIVVAN